MPDQKLEPVVLITVSGYGLAHNIRYFSTPMGQHVVASSEEQITNIIEQLRELYNLELKTPNYLHFFESYEKGMEVLKSGGDKSGVGWKYDEKYQIYLSDMPRDFRFKTLEDAQHPHFLTYSMQEAKAKLAELLLANQGIETKDGGKAL